MRSAVLVYTILAVLQRGLTLLLLPFVTRAMSVTEYGAVAVLATLSALLSALLAGALEQAVFRWTVASQNDSHGRSVVRVCFWWLSTCVPVILFCTAIALWFADTQILQISTHLWAVEVAAVGLMAFVSSYALPQARAEEALRRFVVIATTSIISLLLGKWLFVIILGAGAAGWVLSDLISAVLSFFVAMTLINASRGSVTRAAFLQVLRFALPLVPHIIAFWALAALARPLLAMSMPLEDVGIYSAAFSAASVGTMLLAEVNRATVVAYARDQFPAPSLRTGKVMRIQFLLAFHSAALIGLLSPAFTHWVLPPQYAGVLPLLLILSLASTFYGLYLIPINFIVQTAGITTWSWIGSAAGAVVILLACTVGAAAGGLTVVVLGHVVGYAVMGLIALILIKKMRLQVDWARGGISLLRFAILSTGVTSILCAGLFTVGTIAYLGFSLLGVVTLFGVSLRVLRSSR
ncbi:lipopolysaccharide biosynthesis protein [Cryobacterium sp. Y82]|uniref:lipopolysaccharide biosynthesis protein n=1 Tax=Cryobacterium sp. Y82 TaxID=2045017 RepID=UPI000CE43DCF|nr:oligosaccharide flippase family protein [Cryobacterium sp. Y82]